MKHHKQLSQLREFLWTELSTRMVFNEATKRVLLYLPQNGFIYCLDYSQEYTATGSQSEWTFLLQFSQLLYIT